MSSVLFCSILFCSIVSSRRPTTHDTVDYRFFPDPDLPPLVLSAPGGVDVAAVAEAMPELPDALAGRLREEYGVSARDAAVLVAELGAAPFFEETVSRMRYLSSSREGENERRGGGVKGGGEGKGKDEAALAANWIVNEVFARLNAQGATVRTLAPWKQDGGEGGREGAGDEKRASDDLFLSPRALASLLSLVASEEVSGKAAKEVLDAMFADREVASKDRQGTAAVLRSPQEIVDEFGLGQISDPAVLERLCREAIGLSEEREENVNGEEAEETREMLEAYRGGNKRVFGQFVARVLAASGNRANPKLAAKMLRDLLD